MSIKPLSYLFVTAIATALIASCATTVDSTKSSSETFKNTTKASSDLTSSTSPGGGDDAKAALLMEFTDTNFARLRSDMAVGQGEHLETFATLLSIDDANKVQFYALTKNNFDILFPSAQTTPEQLVNAVHKQLAQAQLS